MIFPIYLPFIDWLFMELQIRLLEHELRELYKKYAADVAKMPGAVVLSEDKFSLVMKKHRRLANIAFARLADNFSDCDKCSEHKALLLKKSLSAQARASTQRARQYHLNEIYLTRFAYSDRALSPEIVDFGLGRNRIDNCLSMAIDAPSLFKLRLPAYPGGRIPKSASRQLQEGFMGTIVHKVQAHAFMITWATSNKVDQTIECIYRTLLETQETYDLPPKLFLQMDNHTGSNKTPAVLAFIAWLIETGVFTEAEINLLFPGHTHIDIDQLFSAWLRRVLDRSRRNVTRTRLMDSIKTHTRNKRQRPSVHVGLEVRSWSAFLKQETTRLCLARYAMPNSSGESVYKFIFKKKAEGVAMTY